MKRLLPAALCATALIPCAVHAQVRPDTRLTQVGTDNKVELKQTDSTGVLSATQAGERNWIYASQYQTDNDTMTVVQAPEIADAKVFVRQQEGAGSTMAVKQSAGASGGVISYSSYGSLNRVTLNQTAKSEITGGQFGIGNTVRIEQKAPSSNDHVSLRSYPALVIQAGDHNNAFVEQAGPDNHLNVWMGHSGGDLSNNGSVTAYQRGAENLTYIDMDGDQNTALLQQNGYHSEIKAYENGADGMRLDIFQSADNSLIDAEQHGTGATAVIRQTAGNMLSLKLTQDLPNARATIDQSGLRNTAIVSQMHYVPPVTPALAQ